jgi:iron complex outermembrane receptor protein
MLALAFSSRGHAQDAAAAAELEEVVITAEKHESSIQNAPVAVSAVSGAEILSGGVTQLDDALKYLPGVVVSQGPGGGFDATIRGVGPSLPTNLGGAAGISTTFDGVFTDNSIASRVGFYDLARIEVLRGPQGTLYGRNAEGGVVATISNNPTFQSQGSASGEIGNYGLVHFTGMLNVPVNDTFAIRVAGGTVQRRGYLSNGQDDNNAVGVRFKALYRPSEAISILWGTEVNRVSGEGQGTVPAFRTSPDVSVAYTNTWPTGQIYERHGYKLWSQLDADVGIGTLTALPSYQRLNYPKQLSATGLVFSHAEGNDPVIERAAELRLASKPESRFSWIVGYYVYSQGILQSNRSTSICVTTATGCTLLTTAPAAGTQSTIVDRPGGTPNLIYSTAKSTGVFAQTTIPLGQALRAIAGIRRSMDDKTVANYSNTNAVLIGVSYAGSWSSTDWKAGLEYDLNPNSMLYLTAATGYRPGGFSPAPPSAADPNPRFENEKLRSYEFGSKNEFLNKTLRANLSVYHYNYSDYQFPNLFPRVGAPGFDLAVLNLPKLKVEGAELELQYLLTEVDRLGVTGTYLKSEVNSPVVVTLPPPGTQLLGQPLPNSPRFVSVVSYQHGFMLAGGGKLTPSVTARYAAQSYVTIPDQPLSHQAAYCEVDASAGFDAADGKWSVNVWGKNLSSVVVKSNYVGNNMTLESPRTFGVVLSARF